MTDANENAGAGAEGTSDEATQNGSTVPIEQYKGLQRETGKTIESQKQRISELEAEVAKHKPAPTAEEELAALRQERDSLKGEVEVERAKAKAPELADVIEKIKAETGKVPSEETLTLLRSRSANGSGASGSSGVHNGPAANGAGSQASTEDRKREELLKSGSLS